MWKDGVVMKQEIYICGKAKSVLIKRVLASLPQSGLEVEANISHIKIKYLDLPYCNLPDSKTLDIYLPDQSNKPFPVVIYFFGGGFLTGDKRGVQITLPLLARRLGFAVVGVNYTLSSEGEYPRLVYEVKASIRYLRANAEKYGLNSEKFIAIGSSSGGTLASLLGTSAGVKELEGLSYGNSEYLSNVQGVVDFCGLTDILALKEQLKEHILKTGITPKISFGNPESLESLLFGALANNVPEKAQAFSPITYVNSHIPPFLIIHGEQDDAVPPQQSIQFAKSIEAIAGKDKAELHILDNAGHCDQAFFKDAVPLMFNFLRKYL